MGDELELKYEIDDVDAVVAWLDDNLPPAAGYGWHTVDMTDLYFDTAGRALARAGYGARLRRLRSHWTVGLKTDLETDGALVKRSEIEGDANAALDPSAWPPSQARDLVQRLATDEPLTERFVLRQRRLRRDFGGLELSVDDVAVRHRRQLVGRLTEMEVEFKSGRRAELRRVGRLLERSGLVRAEPRSKMALAAAMVEGAAPIYPGDALAEAGRKVLARLLDRLVEREEQARAGDVVALKQMRVATRRMRAGWRSFAGAYSRREVRRYVDQLRAVARRLGAVRDLDVLLENLPTDADLDALRGAWQARREELWQELIGALDSADYRRFLDDYRAFVERPGQAATARGRSSRVADAAASLIWAAYERMRIAQPPQRPSVDPEHLHALRIAARQFRYTLEAYRELLDESAATRLFERLVRLQDALGALNDADVAGREVDAWLAVQPEAPGAVEAYRASLAEEVRLEARAVRPSVEGVLGLTFRRALGRAVAHI